MTPCVAPKDPYELGDPRSLVSVGGGLEDVDDARRPAERARNDRGPLAQLLERRPFFSGVAQRRPRRLELGFDFGEEVAWKRHRRIESVRSVTDAALMHG